MPRVTRKRVLLSLYVVASFGYIITRSILQSGAWDAAMFAGFGVMLLAGIWFGKDVPKRRAQIYRIIAVCLAVIAISLNWGARRASESAAMAPSGEALDPAQPHHQ